MNPNVKKMNPHLWIVNYEHVKSGLIKELNQIKAITNGNDMFAISNEGILIINEVEPDMMNLVTIMEFVMKLTDENIEGNNAFKQYLANKNRNVLHWNDATFQTYVGYHHLEDVLAMFNQVATVERARRKAQRKYDRKQQIERLKFWKKKTNTSRR